MSHKSYNSPVYWAQKFKEFLTEEDLSKNYLHKQFGHLFPDIKCQHDSVTFNYLNKEFAVQFIEANNNNNNNNNCDNNVEAVLEIKIGKEWSEIRKRIFKANRNKKGKIRAESFRPIVNSLIIKGFKDYLKIRN